MCIYFCLVFGVVISRGETYTYLRAMSGDLVCNWQWGGGDGLYAESDWGVWRSAPREVV